MSYTHNTYIYIFFFYVYCKNIITLREARRVSTFLGGAPLSRNTADASTYTLAFLDISIAT